MPQTISQTHGYSPPHSTFALVYGAKSTRALDLGFFRPPPQPHAHDVVEVIYHYK